MAGVNVPVKNKQGILGELLPVAGAVVGGVVGGVAGGPPGAIGGASGGYGLGQAAGGFIDPGKQQQLGVSSSQGALQRRQDFLQSDNLTALRNAEVAAARLPERERQAYLPVLTQARIMEQQRRGMVEA